MIVRRPARADFRRKTKRGGVSFRVFERSGGAKARNRTGITLPEGDCLLPISHVEKTGR
jgi:hypothetical protein